MRDELRDLADQGISPTDRCIRMMDGDQQEASDFLYENHTYIYRVIFNEDNEVISQTKPGILRCGFQTHNRHKGKQNA